MGGCRPRKRGNGDAAAAAVIGLADVQFGRYEQPALPPTGIKGQQMPVAIDFVVGGGRLCFLARNENEDDTIPDRGEPAPFHADGNTFAGARVTRTQGGAASADLVVDLLPPETEFIAL